MRSYRIHRQRSPLRVIPVVLAGWLCGCVAVVPPAQAQTTRDLTAEPVAPVVVEPLIEREVAEQREFVGTVMPRRTSTVGSAVEGRVDEFPANEGDYVEKDEVLVRLRDETVQLELAAARAELALREAALAEVEHGSRPDEIAGAKAKMSAAEAARDYAHSRWQRLLALYESSPTAVSRETLDEVESQARTTRHAYDEAASQYRLVQEGPRPERIDQAKANLQAQRQEVARIEDQLQKHTVFAPFAGYVVAEFTEVGQWIKQGDPVCQIVELDTVEITVQVPEQYVQWLRRDMQVSLHVEATGTQPRTGTIDSIVPAADTRARTFPVKIVLKNEIKEQHSPVLKAGMLAKVSLPIQQPRAAVLAPKDALNLQGLSRRLMVLTDPDTPNQPPRVTTVPVEIGVATEDWIEVIGPVRPGQQVVVRGNERLRPGQPVTVVPAEQFRANSGR